MEGDEYVPTVLVVDDTLFMRVTISNMFTEWGYEVVGNAVNGKEAVELYRELQPDLVTMDVTMPVMTGIAAVKRIIPEFPNAKIVMITALGQQKLIVEAIESGAKDFITKPFEPEKLRAVADQLVGQSC
ncbi:response regulator [Lysinibacillus sphaericus]|uniref:Response regulator n=4 Tax=Lysinibacillus TaxID=400634 RepID=A0A2S0K1M4_LYSSH|nr:chemotaxis protein CheY [Lysinibacillus varians]AVK97285.1 response regulator [Lysinibacillus sphaericus]TKI47658.1 response regulator [Lysinibacillus tabacifolii]TKI62832.1 response regulator [Lysinibacillus mangiferihumi]TKI20028.1 response regulator [Lysinibacillus sphaericus]